MLSRVKQVQLAAIAALTVLFSANFTMKTAHAQAGVQFAQADKRDVKRSTTTRRTTVKRAPHHTTRHSTVTRRTTTRHTTVRSGHRYSNNYRYRNGHRYYRSRPSTVVGFTVLGPRAVYRSYGTGWCRALHNGRHWAPRIGWHSGRHVGAVRCR
jgi:Ni/Co efflux regulator RcnB